MNVDITTQWVAVVPADSGTGHVTTISPQGVYLKASVAQPGLSDAGHILAKENTFNFNLGSGKALWARCHGEGMIHVTVDD